MEQNVTRSVLDFDKYVADRTQSFTSRKMVFQAINDWLADPDGPRFFLLTGAPGSGKTAIAARLSQFARGEFAPAELGCFTPGFLDAVHFCWIQDSLWVDPFVFANSVATQLANRYPAYRQALEAPADGHPAHIEVKQEVGSVSHGGHVIGVVINVSGPSPEYVFNRAVRLPLETLLHDQTGGKIVILIDGLDEALLYSGEINIVSLLTRSKSLPAGVRFLLTSRPESSVLSLLQDNNPEIHTLSAGEGLANSLADIERHVSDILNAQPKLAGKLATDFSRVDFAATVRVKSEGNFLYAKYLLQMLVDQKGLISQQSLANFPAGLDGIYCEFLRRLGGEHKEELEERYAAVLGTLAVAQEALTEQQLANFTGMKKAQVRKTLQSLRQFLEANDSLPPSERVYAVYHRSFSDFLLDEDRAQGYWCEAKEEHRRIAQYYLTGFQNSWEGIDPYGLDHLATHLYESGDKEHLHVLISKAWMEARYVGSGYAYNGFRDDITLAWQAELASRVCDVLTLVRLRTAQQAVTQQVSIYTDAYLKTLVCLGRKHEALAHARLRTEAFERFKGLLCVSDALRERGEPDSELINEAERVAYAIPNDVQREMALRNLVVTLTQLGRLSQAEETANAISDVKERAWALSGLAAAMAQARDKRASAVFTQARKIAHAIAEDVRRAEALSNLATALAQAEDKRASTVFIEAEETACATTIEEHYAEALRFLAAALAEAGNKRASAIFTQARKAALAIRSDWERARALSQLAAAMVQARDRRASAVFAQAGEAIRAITLNLDRVTASNNLSVALAQAGYFEQAEETARAIDSNGYRAAALSNLAVALAHAGRFDQAEKTARAITFDWHRAIALSNLSAMLAQTGDSRARAVFVQAEEAARAVTDDQPHDEALRNLTLALMQAGHFKQAEETARAITDNNYRAGALIAVAVALAQAGHFEKAAEIARTLRNSSDRDRVMHELVTALTQAGHFMRAEETARAITDNSKRAEALRSLTAAIAQTGQFTQAEAIASAIEDDTVRVEALINLASTIAEAGDNRASAVFSHAAEIARAIPDNNDRAKVMREQVTALAQIGRFLEAEATALSIPDDEYRAFALKNLATALAQAGDNRASEVFARARESACAIPYDSERCLAMFYVLTALAEADRFAQAEEIARAITDDWERSMALGTVVDELGKAGRFTRAEEVAYTIPYDERLADALCNLASSMAKAGDSRASEIFAEAEKISLAMTYDEERLEALQKLVAAMARAGHFTQAVETVGAITDDWMRMGSLMNLASQMAQAGENRATVIFAHAEELARSISEEETRAEVMHKLAVAMGQAGHFTQAVETARAIRNDGRRDWALSHLATAMANAGCFAQAEETIRAMMDDRKRDWALSDLATALAWNHRFDQALTTLRSRSLDEILQALSNWAPAFEQRKPGLSLAVLREAIEVAGWVSPEWRKIHELLSDAGEV